MLGTVVINIILFLTLQTNCYRDVKGTIYDYEALTLNRNELIQFKQFAGKLILLVNVATYCGLTAQYPGESSEPQLLGTEFLAHYILNHN